MTVAIWIGCAALGAVGALLRAEMSALLTRSMGIGFPWGTLAVNLVGAFAAGALHGSGVGGRATVLVGLSLLGPLTTFSTWMLESLRLLRTAPAAATANIVGSLVGGLALAAAGSSIASAIGA